MRDRKLWLWAVADRNPANTSRHTTKPTQRTVAQGGRMSRDGVERLRQFLHTWAVHTLAICTTSRFPAAAMVVPQGRHESGNSLCRRSSPMLGHAEAFRPTQRGGGHKTGNTDLQGSTGLFRVIVSKHHIVSVTRLF